MVKNHNRLFSSLFLLASPGVFIPLVMANEEAVSKGNILDKVMVIGNPAEVGVTPGSASVITRKELRQQSYDDVNRVLHKVPGIHVREEDGFGLFPNISLRGVDTTRSAKVTLMEDGVLIAPAPYSAPAAYYAPTVGRMSGLEVLKGSSQIKYGPHITGGVINYLSTPVPLKRTAYLKSLAGGFNELRTHAYAGDTLDTGLGAVGFLVEGYFRQNRGFKRIDETPDFRSGEDTGFTKKERMLKLSWEPDSTLYQRLEFKYGKNDLDANETYLGLSEADFAADPWRRYSASRFDNMESREENGYLRYAVGPSDELDIVSTLYATRFKRNWYKLKDLRDLPGSAKMGLSRALAAGGEGLACLKGELSCTLRVRANNREYQAQGIESTLYYRFTHGSQAHEITAGVRYHQDQVRRFQWDDEYIQESNGAISAMVPGKPGEAGDRLQRTTATALFIQDAIRTGRLTLTPGIRYEMLAQRYESPKGNRVGDNRLSLTGGGIGMTYQFDERWTGFGGVHQGFSPPSPKGAVSAGLGEERSLSVEVGGRYINPRRVLAVEAALFYTDFRDLIVVDSVGGAGSGDDENLGEAVAWGLEFSSRYDAGIDRGWEWRNPWYLALTHTNAEQRNDARSTDPESIFSFGRKGNKLPYLPEWQASLGTGVEKGPWAVHVSGTYVGESYTSASNVEEALNGNGEPDARFGKTDAWFVTDLSASYQASERVKLFAGAQNLFDETYIVSRQPHGPRPGLPRFIYAGIEMEL